VTKRRGPSRPSRAAYARGARAVAAYRNEIASLTTPAGFVPRGPVDDCARTRRESDEIVCISCGLRWGVGEDRPTCPKLRDDEIIYDTPTSDD